MFSTAFHAYQRHASDFDELQPISCTGRDTWGTCSLSLIDALDTLLIMGNLSEFSRVADLLVQTQNFDRDLNVSVFETNIRVVGGLLAAHLLSHRALDPLPPGWPCSGPLLSLAEDVARRLLPAFKTKTGMPYGTVNLRCVCRFSLTCSARRVVLLLMILYATVCVTRFPNRCSRQTRCTLWGDGDYMLRGCRDVCR